MKQLTKIVCVLLLIGQNALAEITAESKLMELMQIIESSRFASGTQPNYQVTNACFYTIYGEWETRYLAILRNIPLDESKISSLNIYAEFAASIRRDIHLLRAYYPNLFSNIKLYIQDSRAQKMWPVGPQNITLEEIDNIHLGENMASCYASSSISQLSRSVVQADYVAGNKALNDVITATFVKNQRGGLELEVKVNKKTESNIPGVYPSNGSDDYLTPIPANK